MVTPPNFRSAWMTASYLHPQVSAPSPVPRDLTWTPQAPPHCQVGGSQPATTRTSGSWSASLSLRLSTPSQRAAWTAARAGWRLTTWCTLWTDWILHSIRSLARERYDILDLWQCTSFIELCCLLYWQVFRSKLCIWKSKCCFLKSDWKMSEIMIDENIDSESQLSAVRVDSKTNIAWVWVW